MVLETLKIYSILFDKKINAFNISFEVTKKDYLFIAPEIKKNNDLQRRKVKTASTVYSLMKEDLKAGCLLPPLVLALDKDSEVLMETLEKKTYFDENTFLQIKKYIQENYAHIKILDGLQRTNILLEVEEELKGKNSSAFYDKNLRCEIYIGINRSGILYRMLTLNTGQTPMTLRHQIEILYSDMYKEINNTEIHLIRETEGISRVGIGKYRFSDIVEGVNAYIEGSELSMDRYDLLEYIKGLQMLSRQDNQKDIFQRFVDFYDQFIRHLNEASNNWKFDFDKLTQEEQEIVHEPKNAFGSTVIDIFTRSQVITGLGAALSELKRKNRFQNFDDLFNIIPQIGAEERIEDGLNLLITRLAKIQKESKRIGQSQRTFFKDFFISLLDQDGSEFKIGNAVDRAFRLNFYSESYA